MPPGRNEIVPAIEAMTIATNVVIIPTEQLITRIIVHNVPASSKKMVILNKLVIISNVGERTRSGDTDLITSDALAIG
jgi:hypothetical protein